MSPEQAEKMLSEVVFEEEQRPPGQLLMDRLSNREADKLMDTLFGQLGETITLSGLLQAVTGEDLMETLRPLLIRHIGSFLDQGLAAWNAPDRSQGFYSVWRNTALQDMAWVFD